MKSLLLLTTVLAAFHISHSTPDYCREGPNPGQGTNFTFFVFYDHASDRCNPFFYNGEGGNGNRFTSESDCLRTCSPNAENTYPMDVRKVCRLKHTTGECGGTFLRYYYDSVHDKCKKFLWTGCNGNGNRFFDAESCNATCAGIHDDREEEEEDEPDTPIAIICGVLLGVIILAVIIAVTVLTIQSKNKKKKSSKQAPKAKTNEPQVESPLQESGIEMA
ncbi:inter-alpha-trypsin inhibitor [Nothobranchius furzeri]|uniref:Inter-alpha-trypsin inhibitor-like n=3 Tax=Nothobranchius furzeri TaxID=105023 RepID=A0A8C6LQP1_NOTFU|nr:BPTI/Kunitz domain-containing protein [Nothobranchius furzeri]KAF7224396.1 inter-alpha-trypsin inhibitor-like [Nothobranchius furzeri]